MSLEQSPFFKELVEHLRKTEFLKVMLKVEESWSDAGVPDWEEQLKVKEYVTNLADKMVEHLLHIQEDELKIIEEEEELMAKNKEERSKLMFMLKEAPTSPPGNFKLFQEAKWIREDLNRLRAEKDKRMSSYLEMIVKKEELEELLGSRETVFDTESIPQPSVEKKLKSLIDELIREKEWREQSIFVMTERMTELISIMGYGDLNATSISGFIHGGSTTMKIKDIKEMQKTMKELENMYEVKTAEVTKMITNIRNLYAKLEIPDVEQLCLVTGAVCSINQLLAGENYNEIVEENAHMEKLKQENIGVFLNKSVMNLETLQEQALLSKQEIENFFQSVEHLDIEDKLDAVEVEISKLREYIFENETLIESVLDILNLKKLSIDLKARMNDPKRLFKARGNQMFKEESDRRKVNTIPKLCENLLEIDTDLLVYGETLDQFVQKILDNFFDNTEKKAEAKNTRPKPSRTTRAQPPYPGDSRTLPNRKTKAKGTNLSGLSSRSDLPMRQTSSRLTRQSSLRNLAGLERRKPVPPVQVKLTHPSPSLRSEDMFTFSSVNSTELGSPMSDLDSIRLDEASTLMGGNIDLCLPMHPKSLQRSRFRSPSPAKGVNKRSALRRSKSYSDLNQFRSQYRSRIPQVNSVPEEESSTNTIPRRGRSQKPRRRSRSIGDHEDRDTRTSAVSEVSNSTNSLLMSKTSNRLQTSGSIRMKFLR